MMDASSSWAAGSVAVACAAAAVGCACVAYSLSDKTAKKTAKTLREGGENRAKGADADVDGRRRPSPYPTGENDRPASKTEVMMQSMHSQGKMHTVCLVRVGGRALSLADASRAAESVARRHAVMRMRLVAGSDEKNPRALWLRERRPDGTEWGLDVSFVSGRASLVQTGEELCNSVMFPGPEGAPPSPLWRLVVVRNDAGGEQGLAFVLHHGVFDGTSRFRVVKDFMTALASLSAPVESDFLEPVAMSPTLQQQGSLQEAMAASWGKTWAIRARYAYNTLLGPPSWSFPLEARPKSSKAVAVAATRIRPVAFSAQHTSQLRQSCKENGTTVHAAVCAAAQLALLDISGEKGTVHVTMNHLASTRHLAKPQISDQTLGLFISMYSTQTELSAEASDPWEAARTLKAQLVAESREPAAFWLRIPAMILCSLLGIGYGGRAEAAAKRFGLLNVSNLGVQHFEEDYAGYTVEGVYSGTAEHQSGPVVCFNLSTVRGRLHGTIMYYQPVWGEETAAQFEEALRARLSAMLS